MWFCIQLFFFFFQAEDGIRDRDVTGVQTCALPIVERCALRLRCHHSQLRWCLALGLGDEPAWPERWPALGLLCLECRAGADRLAGDPVLAFIRRSFAGVWFRRSFAAGPTIGSPDRIAWLVLAASFAPVWSCHHLSGCRDVCQWGRGLGI